MIQNPPPRQAVPVNACAQKQQIAADCARFPCVAEANGAVVDFAHVDTQRQRGGNMFLLED